MNIAEQLKTGRQQTGLTQAAVAEQIGISRRALAYYETGEHIPNADVLYKLCVLYGIPLEQVVDSQLEQKGAIPTKDDLLLEKINEYLLLEERKKQSFNRGLLLGCAVISAVLLVAVAVLCFIRFRLSAIYGYTFSEATAKMWTELFEYLIVYVNDPAVKHLPIASIVIVSTVALLWLIYFAVIFVKRMMRTRKK